MIQRDVVSDKEAINAIKEGGVSVNKFVNESLPDQKMYITPWLVQNTISLVASQRGVGKSWFLHILATMLTYPANGLCLEPWTVGERTKVLLVDGELSEHDLQNRFKGLVGHEESHEDLFVLSKNRQYRLDLPSPNIADKNWQDGIYEYICKSDYNVVMFDNMSCLAMGLDELRKKEWDPVIEFFLRLRFAGKTVLFAHHLGKQGGSGPRGSSCLEDPVDYSIRLDKVGKEHGTEAKFKLSFTKARHLLGLTGGNLEINLQNHDDGSVGCMSNIIQPTQEKPSKEKDIIALLITIPMLSQAAISKKMNVTPQHISKVKKEAISEGYLEEFGDKRILTSKGKEFYGDIVETQNNESVEPK